MATYAIGDLQGCHEELLALLEQVAFNPREDRLWFTGDLVNRGPKSLETLRFVAGLGERAITVLGNHDLHLLAVAEGHTHRLRRKDTLNPILDAPDREALLDWLRRRPLLHHDPVLGYTLVHAGLPPQWGLRTARERAAELETVLRGGYHARFYVHMYGDQPDRWRDTLADWDRLRFITNAFTRMRNCDRDGRLDPEDKGPDGTQRAGNMPWFAVPGRASAGERIIFGHWSTLQLEQPVDPAHRVFPLDNGCLWGGRLTALRLEDGSYHHLPCPGYSKPKVPRNFSPV